MAVTKLNGSLSLWGGRRDFVPEPIERPTESEERTTESVTQEYKFIFPLSYKSITSLQEAPISHFLFLNKNRHTGYMQER